MVALRLRLIPALLLLVLSSCDSDSNRSNDGKQPPRGSAQDAGAEAGDGGKRGGNGGASNDSPETGDSAGGSGGAAAGGSGTGKGHAGSTSTPSDGSTSDSGVDSGSDTGTRGRSDAGARPPPPPTTVDLLTAAVAAGEITDDQALVYRVFALYHDDRLPMQYRSAAALPDENHGVMLRAANRFDALTEEQQADIGIYFVPPAYWPPRNMPVPVLMNAPDRPGGCSHIFNDGWKSFDSDHFRVWYNGVDAQLSDATRRSGEAELAYTKLVGSGRFVAPLSDASRWSCDGGDGRIDVYLLPIDANGVTTPLASTAGGTPTAVFITLDPPAEPGSLAHEITHAIQYGITNMGAPSYNWAAEATAAWARHLVYPTDTDGWDDAANFMRLAEEPLFFPNAFDGPFADARDPGTGSRNTRKMYGGFIFFSYVAAKAVNYDLVSEFFTHAAAYPDSLADLDFVLSAAGESGLKNTWPNFVLALWNDDPIGAGLTFRGIDPTWLTTWREAKEDCVRVLPGQCTLDADLQQITPTASSGVEERTLPSSPRGPGEGPRTTLALPELSATYERFQFDPSFRQVLVFNGYSQRLSRKTVTHVGTVGPTQSQKTLDVEHFANYDATATQVSGRSLFALEQIGGTWKKVDLTQKPFFTLCLDRASERITELVLVFSNGNFTAARGGSFEAGAAGRIDTDDTRLLASTAPCYEYEGHYATQIQYSDSQDHLDISSNFDATYVGEAKTQAFTDLRGSGTAFIGWLFTATAASLQFTTGATGNLKSCGFSYPIDDQRTFGASFFTTSLPTFYTIVSTPLDPAFNGYAGSSMGVQWHTTGCSNPEKVLPAANSTDFYLTYDRFRKIDTVSGRLISGSDDRNFAASSAPVYDQGDYASVGDASYTWCFAAVRQDDQGSDEAVPDVCQ